jgi:hypothetical protein
MQWPHWLCRHETACIQVRNRMRVHSPVMIKHKNHHLNCSIHNTPHVRVGVRVRARLQRRSSPDAESPRTSQ